MKRFPLLAAVSIICFLPSTSFAAKVKVEKELIDQAIERGVAALRQMQGGDGRWAYINLGPTALAGLTLLECGVAADDPAVVKAADTIRLNSPGFNTTYVLSLGIL